MKNILLLTLFLLCSCTTTTQNQGTIRVYDNIIYQNVKPLLLADFTKHGIITEDLPVFNPAQLFKKEWGFISARKLYNNLALSFRYPSVNDSKFWTFANLEEEYTNPTMYSYGFTVNHGLELVTVSLLGDLDWDKNNTTDWLIYCRFEEQQSKDKKAKNNIRLAREYLLIVTDRSEAYWQASPVIIRDLKLYSVGYDSAIYRNLTLEKQKALEPNFAIDFEIGQTKILEQPEKIIEKNKQPKKDSLNEQSLSE